MNVKLFQHNDTNRRMFSEQGQQVGAMMKQVKAVRIMLVSETAENARWY